MTNELLGVRILCNQNNITYVEIDTTYGKKKLRLPYTVTITERGDKYNYSMSVKSWCKAMNINYKRYFNLIHKDCN